MNIHDGQIFQLIFFGFRAFNLKKIKKFTPTTHMVTSSAVSSKAEKNKTFSS